MRGEHPQSGLLFLGAHAQLGEASSAVLDFTVPFTTTDGVGSGLR